MLTVLERWNRWGRAVLNSGYPRDITPTVLPFLHSKEVVALVGLRRAGKTTVLYQLMDQLEKEGIPQTACLHMNFEEPALAPQLGVQMLDDLYQQYREVIYPTGKAYLFLDEIQVVPGWEKWVRARNESEDIKIFITGSSASLMSRELATVLTGRHVEFYVTPFSFAEVLRIKNIALPNQLLPVDPPATIQNTLNEYAAWGGFPEVVLSDNDDRKEILLKQYFEDIIFKDVAMRYEIRDVVTLRNMAVHLMTQTGCLFSVSRMASLFQVSKDMAANYCQAIQESFLVDYLSVFSLKTAERNRNPQKIHVNDLGLRRIASLSTSPDHGKLAETLVYQQLQRQHRNQVFYWKGRQEVDFVIQQGNSITKCIQVAYDNLGDERVCHRELSALDEAIGVFPKASMQLIAGRMPSQVDKRMVPLWQFLLPVA